MLKYKIKQLKAMHELMVYANDEEIYYTWVALAVPDCPLETDFEDIAEDDELYHECFDLFVKLVTLKGNRYGRPPQKHNTEVVEIKRSPMARLWAKVKTILVKPRG